MSNINIITTKKFKDVVVNLRFANQDQSKKTQRALLALMLVDRSAKYNNKVLMNSKLNEMFGASLHSSVRDYGQAHILDLSLGVLNEKFVKADLLEEQIELLYQLVYYPLLSEDVFLEAKQVLEDIYNRESDNLGSYANKQALKIAGEGFPLAENRIGTLEKLEKLTLKDIKNELESILENDVLHITVIGDVNKESTKKLIESRFTNNKKYSSFKHNYLVKSEDVIYKTEYKDTQQAYMTLVYDTNTLNIGKDYWVLQIMSMILGQLPNSFLFQEVREKHSLSYTISSNVRGYDGIMHINAGVRLDSIDKAIEISKAQVLRLQAGDFSDELFDSAITMLIDQIYKTDDSNRRMIDSYYRRQILNEDYDTKKLISLISDISAEEVVEIANKLKLNTVYKLVRKDNNE